eukprot:scaffold2468_cov226-Pinguiococcus_pyrenoidosus.AAC.2
MAAQDDSCNGLRRKEEGLVDQRHSRPASDGSWCDNAPPKSTSYRPSSSFPSADRTHAVAFPTASTYHREICERGYMREGRHARGETCEREERREKRGDVKRRLRLAHLSPDGPEGVCCIAHVDNGAVEHLGHADSPGAVGGQVAGARAWDKEHHRSHDGLVRGGFPEEDLHDLVSFGAVALADGLCGGQLVGHRRFRFQQAEEAELGGAEAASSSEKGGRGQGGIQDAEPPDCIVLRYWGTCHAAEQAVPRPTGPPRGGAGGLPLGGAASRWRCAERERLAEGPTGTPRQGRPATVQLPPAAPQRTASSIATTWPSGSAGYSAQPRAPRASAVPHWCDAKKEQEVASEVRELVNRRHSESPQQDFTIFRVKVKGKHAA